MIHAGGYCPKGHPYDAILRGTLAAMAFTSTVWLMATPTAADDFETCGKASGDEAIAACTRAIDSGRYSGRQLAALFNNRCSEWNGKQESDKAFADCNEAIRLNPDYALAFFNRGNAYFAKGQYDRAIEDYNETIRLDPNYANAFNNRGNTYNATANSTAPSRISTKRSGLIRTWR